MQKVTSRVEKGKMLCRTTVNKELSPDLNFVSLASKIFGVEKAPAESTFPSHRSQ